MDPDLAPCYNILKLGRVYPICDIAPLLNKQNIRNIKKYCIKHDRQCFIGISKHLEESLKYDARQSILTKFRVFGKPMKSLSQVSEVSRIER